VALAHAPLVPLTFEHPNGPVRYELAWRPLAVTEPPFAPLYSYVLAANGVFVRARRQGLAVQMPIAPMPVGALSLASGTSGTSTIRGLAPLVAAVHLTVPRIPAPFLSQMLLEAQAACDVRGQPVETLFHLAYRSVEDTAVNAAISSFSTISSTEPRQPAGWRLWAPPQARSASSVTLLPTLGASDVPETFRVSGDSGDSGDSGAGAQAHQTLVEAHSHHAMDAYFSATDDADEQGFRLYVVLGRIFTQPCVRVRVGVYGYFFAIPATLLFELPPSIVDASGLSASLASSAAASAGAADEGDPLSAEWPAARRLREIGGAGDAREAEATSSAGGQGTPSDQQKQPRALRWATRWTPEAWRTKLARVRLGGRAQSTALDRTAITAGGPADEAHPAAPNDVASVDDRSDRSSTREPVR